MTLLAHLQPGDAILYQGKGLYGWLIRFHTGHVIGHVEVYLGLGLSSASRDGKGVNLYPLRESDALYIWRPVQPFNAARGMSYTVEHKGEPYGWLDLLAFVGANVDGKGIVCSPWATNLYRDQGINPFNKDPSRLIAPCDFLKSNAGQVIEVSNGEVLSDGV